MRIYTDFLKQLSTTGALQKKQKIDHDAYLGLMLKTVLYYHLSSNTGILISLFFVLKSRTFLLLLDSLLSENRTGRT